MRDYAPNCPGCRDMYEGRLPAEAPPCESCRVVLLTVNEDPARVYQRTRGQVIALGEQVFDLNHLAVWEAIDRYHVQDPVRCFELVNRIFHHFLSKERDMRS